MWRRIVGAIYGVDAYDWTSTVPKKERKSRLWASILKHKEQFFKFTEFIVGNGKAIRFWEDSWCDSQPLVEKFPDIFTLSLNKDDVIVDYWCASNQT